MRDMREGCGPPTTASVRLCSSLICPLLTRSLLVGSLLATRLRSSLEVKGTFRFRFRAGPAAGKVVMSLPSLSSLASFASSAFSSSSSSSMVTTASTATVQAGTFNEVHVSVEIEAEAWVEEETGAKEEVAVEADLLEEDLFLSEEDCSLSEGLFEEDLTDDEARVEVEVEEEGEEEV
jgi:phage-related tail fiber protein